MLETIKNSWKIPELRNKILFTIFALLIFRLGSAIPVPFIDNDGLSERLSSASATIFGLLNVMSGDAFAHATVFALSIQPYINASIIIQLLAVAIPALERMQKEEGEEGKKKIASITRYVTVAIGFLQGYGYYALIKSYGLLETIDGASTLENVWMAIVIIVAFTAGSSFLMWLGEQITEFGIGNGISIILFASIISRGPHLVATMYYGAQKYLGIISSSSYVSIPVWAIPILVLCMLLIVMLVVFINGSERRIPVQYAKRVVGRKMYGGQSTHLPMKVNMSGVLPIIFAQSIASIPATIGAFVPSASVDGTGWNKFLTVFDSTGLFYSIVYFLLIIGFSYFYGSIQFNPVEVSNNLKKNGGFVPGFRPGRPTADFLKKVLNKVTMFGAIYLGVLAIAPIIVTNLFGISRLAIGGTSVIIVVGVALETVKNMEAQMMMRHYKGFLE
ncbi:MAG: preprotein translocase subunit SecY [Oscillospiraceae bacterium]|nr:preprotein translocase subunit SecY [Oscillospiraceae bacterium]